MPVARAGHHRNTARSVKQRSRIKSGPVLTHSPFSGERRLCREHAVTRPRQTASRTAPSVLHALRTSPLQSPLPSCGPGLLRLLIGGSRNTSSAARKKLFTTLVVDRDGRPQSVEVSGGGADSEDLRQHVRQFILENWKLHKARPEDPALRKFKVPIYFTLKGPGEKPQPQEHFDPARHLFPQKAPPATSSSPSPTP